MAQKLVQQYLNNPQPRFIVEAEHGALINFVWQHDAWWVEHVRDVTIEQVDAVNAALNGTNWYAHRHEHDMPDRLQAYFNGGAQL